MRFDRLDPTTKFKLPETERCGVIFIVLGDDQPFFRLAADIHNCFFKLSTRHLCSEGQKRPTRNAALLSFCLLLRLFFRETSGYYHTITVSTGSARTSSSPPTRGPGCIHTITMAEIAAGEPIPVLVAGMPRVGGISAGP